MPLWRSAARRAVAAFEIPLKRFYKYILKRLIGGFLRREIDLSQLDVQLAQGTAELKRLSLDLDQFNVLFSDAGLKLHFVGGMIGCIKVDIPLRHLLRDPCKVYVSGLHLVVCVGSSATDMFGPSARGAAPLQQGSTSSAGARDSTAAPSPGREHYSEDGIQTLLRLVKLVLSRTEVCFQDVSIALVSPNCQQALRARLASIVAFAEADDEDNGNGNGSDHGEEAAHGQKNERENEEENEEEEEEEDEEENDDRDGRARADDVEGDLVEGEGRRPRPGAATEEPGRAEAASTPSFVDEAAAAAAGPQEDLMLATARAIRIAGAELLLESRELAIEGAGEEAAAQLAGGMMGSSASSSSSSPPKPPLRIVLASTSAPQTAPQDFLYVRRNRSEEKNTAGGLVSGFCLDAQLTIYNLRFAVAPQAWQELLHVLTCIRKCLQALEEPGYDDPSLAASSTMHPPQSMVQSFLGASFQQGEGGRNFWQDFYKIFEADALNSKSSNANADQSLEDGDDGDENEPAKMASNTSNNDREVDVDAAAALAEAQLASQELGGPLLGVKFSTSIAHFAALVSLESPSSSAPPAPVAARAPLPTNVATVPGQPSQIQQHHLQFSVEHCQLSATKSMNLEHDPLRAALKDPECTVQARSITLYIHEHIPKPRRPRDERPLLLLSENFGGTAKAATTAWNNSDGSIDLADSKMPPTTTTFMTTAAGGSAAAARHVNIGTTESASVLASASAAVPATEAHTTQASRGCRETDGGLTLRGPERFVIYSQREEEDQGSITASSAPRLDASGLARHTRAIHHSDMFRSAYSEAIPEQYRDGDGEGDNDDSIEADRARVVRSPVASSCDIPTESSNGGLSDDDEDEGLALDAAGARSFDSVSEADAATRAEAGNASAASASASASGARCGGENEDPSGSVSGMQSLMFESAMAPRPAYLGEIDASVASVPLHAVSQHQQPRVFHVPDGSDDGSSIDSFDKEDEAVPWEVEAQQMEDLFFDRSRSVRDAVLSAVRTRAASCDRSFGGAGGTFSTEALAQASGREGPRLLHQRQQQQQPQQRQQEKQRQELSPEWSSTSRFRTKCLLRLLPKDPIPHPSGGEQQGSGRHSRNRSGSGNSNGNKGGSSDRTESRQSQTGREEERGESKQQGNEGENTAMVSSVPSRWLRHLPVPEHPLRDSPLADTTIDGENMTARYSPLLVLQLQLEEHQQDVPDSEEEQLSKWQQLKWQLQLAPVVVSVCRQSIQMVATGLTWLTEPTMTRAPSSSTIASHHGHGGEEGLPGYAHQLHNDGLEDHGKDEEDDNDGDERGSDAEEVDDHDCAGKRNNSATRRAAQKQFDAAPKSASLPPSTREGPGVPCTFDGMLRTPLLLLEVNLDTPFAKGPLMAVALTAPRAYMEPFGDQFEQEVDGCGWREKLRFEVDDACLEVCSAHKSSRGLIGPDGTDQDTGEMTLVENGSEGLIGTACDVVGLELSPSRTLRILHLDGFGEIVAHGKAVVSLYERSIVAIPDEDDEDDEEENDGEFPAEQVSSNPTSQQERGPGVEGWTKISVNPDSAVLQNIRRASQRLLRPNSSSSGNATNPMTSTAFGGGGSSSAGSQGSRWRSQQQQQYQQQQQQQRSSSSKLLELPGREPQDTLSLANLRGAIPEALVSIPGEVKLELDLERISVLQEVVSAIEEVVASLPPKQEMEEQAGVALTLNVGTVRLSLLDFQSTSPPDLVDADDLSRGGATATATATAGRGGSGGGRGPVKGASSSKEKEGPGGASATGKKKNSARRSSDGQQSNPEPLSPLAAASQQHEQQLNLLFSGLHARILQSSNAPLMVRSICRSIGVDVLGEGDMPEQVVRSWYRPIYDLAVEPRAIGTPTRRLPVPPMPSLDQFCERRVHWMRNLFLPELLSEDTWRDSYSLLAEVDQRDSGFDIALTLSRIACQSHPERVKNLQEQLLAYLGCCLPSRSPIVKKNGASASPQEKRKKKKGGASVSADDVTSKKEGLTKGNGLILRTTLLDCLVDQASGAYAKDWPNTAPVDGRSSSFKPPARGSDSDRWRSVLHLDNLEVTLTTPSLATVKPSLHLAFRECNFFLVDHPFHLAQLDLVMDTLRPIPFLKAMGFAHLLTVIGVRAMLHTASQSSVAKTATDSHEALDLSIEAVHGHLCADTVRSLLSLVMEFSETFALPSSSSSSSSAPPQNQGDCGPFAAAAAHAEDLTRSQSETSNLSSIPDFAADETPPAAAAAAAAAAATRSGTSGLLRTFSATTSSTESEGSSSGSGMSGGGFLAGVDMFAFDLSRAPNRGGPVVSTSASTTAAASAPVPPPLPETSQPAVVDAVPPTVTATVPPSAPAASAAAAGVSARSKVAALGNDDDDADGEDIMLEMPREGTDEDEMEAVQMRSCCLDDYIQSQVMLQSPKLVVKASPDSHHFGGLGDDDVDHETPMEMELLELPEGYDDLEGGDIIGGDTTTERGEDRWFQQHSGATVAASSSAPAGVVDAGGVASSHDASSQKAAVCLLDPQALSHERLQSFWEEDEDARLEVQRLLDGELGPQEEKYDEYYARAVAAASRFASSDDTTATTTTTTTSLQASKAKAKAEGQQQQQRRQRQAVQRQVLEPPSRSRGSSGGGEESVVWHVDPSTLSVVTDHFSDDASAVSGLGAASSARRISTSLGAAAAAAAAAPLPPLSASATAPAPAPSAPLAAAAAAATPAAPSTAMGGAAGGNSSSSSNIGAGSGMGPSARAKAAKLGRSLLGFHCEVIEFSICGGDDFEKVEVIQVASSSMESCVSASKPNRRRHYIQVPCLTLQIKETNLQLTAFDQPPFRRRLRLSIRDFAISDHVPSSHFSHLVAYYADEQRGPRVGLNSDCLRRRPSGSMIFQLLAHEVVTLDDTTVHASPGAAAPEYRVDLCLLPLRLTVDQDVVDFLLKFVQLCTLPGYVEEPQEWLSASFMDGEEAEGRSTWGTDSVRIDAAEKAAVAANGSPSFLETMFFQHFSVGPLLISVDYRAKRLDVEALKSGQLWQLVNLIPILEGLRIPIRSATVRGITGINQVGVNLVQAWSADVNRTQVLRSLTGVTPIRSFTNITDGFVSMVMEPLQMYRAGSDSERVSRSLLRGLVSFLRNVTVESIDLTERVLVGAQSSLEFVSSYIEEPQGTSSSSSGLPGRSHTQNVPRAPQVPPRPVPAPAHAFGDGEDDDELWTSVERGASEFMQPASTADGLKQAFHSLYRGVRHAGEAIAVRPFLELQRGASREKVLKSVVAGIPVFVLRPTIGATAAVTTALRGVRNSVDPRHRREVEGKYKGPS